MRWYFQPGPGSDGARGNDDDDDAPGLLGLTAELLERHGARVLRPGHAAVVAGDPAPRSTVYRARTLLVPGDLLQDAGLFGAVDEILATIGLRLVRPEGDTDPDPERGDPEVFRAL